LYFNYDKSSKKLSWNKTEFNTYNEQL